jgi:hypothetical protein
MYEYFDEMYTVGDEGDSLEHHGILGQKWGIRRFQNYDGTLIHPKGRNKAKTKEDRKKERSERRAKKKEAKAAANTAKAEAKAAKEAEEKAKKEEEERVKTRADIDKAIANVDIKEIARLKGQMTLDDLQAASKRALAMAQISTGTTSFSNATKEKTTLDKVLGGLETTKKIADTVKNAHESVAALKKEFGFDAESLAKKADGDKGKKESKSDDSAEKKANSVFNRINDLTSKINEDRQKKKFQSELGDLKRRDKDSKTLEWLQSISGSNKPTPKPKAGFESPFKLGNGDYSVFKSSSQREKNESWYEKLKSAGNLTSVKLSDISVPKTVTSTVKKITSPNSPTGQTPIDDVKKMFSGVDSLTDDLLKRNQL